MVISVPVIRIQSGRDVSAAVTVSIKPGLFYWPTVTFQQILKVISFNGMSIKADWASVLGLAGKD